jgi:hypothetical protein
VFGYPLRVALGGSGSGSVGSAPPGIDCPATSCAATFPAASDVELSAHPDSASGFVAWGGACAGPTPSCVVTIDGPTDVSARFDATVALEEDGAGTAYTWGRRTDRRALGGSYRWERRAGATTSFGFTGGAVSLFTIEGPSFGRGRIAIDGATVDTFDGYAGDPGRGDRLRFEDLGHGHHTLTVTVLGTARPKATGTRVGVDGLRASGVLDASPDPTASTWGPVTDGSASGGTYVASEAPGATAAIRFRGTGITLRTLRGPALGVVELWVDGSRRRTWDLSAASWSYGVRRTLTGLTDGTHVARLVVVGSTGADHHGAAVAVDGWIVR